MRNKQTWEVEKLGNEKESSKENGKYTITDVAEMMGVSKSTISRAMNGSPGVGKELRQKVLSFVDEIGYQPNALAKGLSKGRLNIVALILGDIRNPFYADLAFYIQKDLREDGFMVMVFNSEYDSQKEMEFIQRAIQLNFAGLILLTAQKKEIRKKLEQVEIPVVLVNRILEGYEGDSVLLDNFKAGYIATMHLIELGHPKVAFVSGQSTSSASMQRYEGYRQALKTYGIAFDESWVFYSDLRMDTGYQVAKEYIADLDSRPSAVVVSNDMTAIGFIECCRENQIKIPEQISLVSFDDIEIASLYDLQITTVSQHVQEMSRRAAKLMHKRLLNPEGKAERVILDPTLMVRKTTCQYQAKNF